MMSSCQIANLLHPVSFVSYGFFLYSIVNIFTGVTYVRGEMDICTKPVYFEGQPKFFILIVSFNIIFALILFDFINDVGIIRTFKILVNIF